MKVAGKTRRDFLRMASATSAAAFLPALCEAQASLPQMPREELRRLLRRLFVTQDDRLYEFATEVYATCVLGKLKPPDPPLNYAWIVPGGGYYAQWLWDTMFVVDLLAVLPGQAEIIRGVFQNYWDFQKRWDEAKPAFMHGMIANFMAPFDSPEVRQGKEWQTFPAYSQAPLLAWGMERVFLRNGDKQLLQDGLAPLERFHDWYWRERDVTNVGLVGVGSYSGDAQHARYETYDREVDLDGLHLTPHPGRSASMENGAWYGDVLIPANTAYLLLSEMSLARMATLMGDAPMARRRRQRYDLGIAAMRRHMWSASDACFLAVDRATLRPIRPATVGGFVPLMAKVPDASQAAAMARMLATEAWATPLPIPTVARTTAQFSSGEFWRGDVWPAPNYQVASGLAALGQRQAAARIADVTVENALKHGISERYDSLSGAPLGVQGLGMSATTLDDAARRSHQPLLHARAERFMRTAPLLHCASALLAAAACHAAMLGQSPLGQSPVLTVDWNSLGAPTRTTITLQVVENPPLMRGSSIHDAAWKAFSDLKAEKARLALWYPYPRMAVAELAPPSATGTSWDFSAIDPIVEDFFTASGNRSTVFTISTIPTWMFAQASPGPVPVSPAEAMWNYEDGAALRDPSGTEAATYFGRVAAWYTHGGFEDERGVHHASGYHFRLPYWEVLNEPEYEHALSIETYTRVYDAVSKSVHAVIPETKFVGMSLAEPTKNPAAFEYFLDPSHHASGTPLDAISYHFYADAEPGESDKTQQYTFFDHVDAFLDSVRYIEHIRKRLSPHTETHINEAGCIAADDLAQGAEHTNTLPSPAYWSLCGATFAYLYVGLAEQGIDLLGASQLLGYPSQFPSVSLLDWNTGRPNARYSALKLLEENFGPGDRPAKIGWKRKDIVVAAYVSPTGRKRLLLINKRNKESTLQITAPAGAKEGMDQPRIARLYGELHQ